MSAHFTHHVVTQALSDDEWRSLRWLAARYESAQLLLDYLDNNTNEDTNTTYLTCDQAQQIANLCTEDGSSWGHVPCLGGRVSEYFLQALGTAC